MFRFLFLFSLLLQFLLACVPTSGFSVCNLGLARPQIRSTRSLQSSSDEQSELDVQEKAWRYAGKPLLRIGVKGATSSHGNSLRQLLEDHQVVKVKVNTKAFGGSVEQAYERLKELTIASGAPPTIELIQLREGPKEIAFGMPGTLALMEEGSFPPVEEVEESQDVNEI